MRNSFYNSWVSLIVFVALIIFVPYKVSLYNFKVSDIWLLLCLSFQYVHGFSLKINLRNGRFLKRFGIWMGIIAIIATLFQALQDDTPFDPVFLSEFFRFFRYFLIFKLVEQIILNSRQNDLSKFLEFYTLIGVIVIIFSFIEFYSIGSFQKVIVNLYYVAPDLTFGEYFEEHGRLSGVLGNSNATAIYITSTLVFPAFSLILRKGKFLNRLFLTIYILLAGFVIVAMTSSRTSVIISSLLFLFLFILSFSRVKNFVRLFFIIIISLITGIYFYNQYSPKITFPDRVTFLFGGKNSKGEKVGLIESMGRNELWQDRFNTFKNHAHPFAPLTGMGYTRVYKDYSDNGLLSSFFNTGLIGLLLRLILYYLVARYSFWQSFKSYRKSGNNYLPLIFGVVSFVFILWELTCDMIEHIKIGQIFFLFFLATVVYNANYYRLRRMNTHLLKKNTVFSYAEN